MNFNRIFGIDFLEIFNYFRLANWLIKIRLFSEEKSDASSESEAEGFEDALDKSICAKGTDGLSESLLTLDISKWISKKSISYLCLRQRSVAVKAFNTILSNVFLYTFWIHFILIFYSNFLSLEWKKSSLYWSSVFRIQCCFLRVINSQKCWLRHLHNNFKYHRCGILRSRKLRTCVRNFVHENTTNLQ